MPQDAFTLKFLCDELNILFAKGKVNKIVQPDNEQVVLTIYTGKGTEKLLLDVNPANPRIGVSQENFESPLTAPNFCMLLRKHLLSATIEHISIVGFDRVVKIDFIPSNEFFDNQKKTLYVELMGRYSNIILTENNKVLGGNRGVNFFDNGVRPLIVNREYVLPPVFNKKHPTDRDLIEIFSKKDESLSSLIIESVQGFSLSTAKEIEDKIKDAKDVSNFGERVYETLNDFIYNSKVNPCVLLEDNCVSDVFAFPYKTFSGELKFFDKLYMAEEFYFQNKLLAKRIRELKNRLLSVVNTALKKTKKKIIAINSRYVESEKAEENRIKGELLLANIYKIKNGESKVLLDNYYDNSKVEILLDEKLSVSKNAENYYKKYNKQKRALAILSEQLNGVRIEEEYLDGLVSMISISNTLEELTLIKEELIVSDLIKEQTRREKRKANVKNYREYFYLGHTIKVGRNNIENDQLTLSARRNDIWVHSKDYHSSHVIIERGEREISEEVILRACEICAYYSKGRNGGKNEVVYTERKNVKKPARAKPGFFTYNEYKSVLVFPDNNEKYLKID